MSKDKSKPYRIELETFRPFDAWAAGQYKQDEPSCFGGFIRVRRYRIVCEEIEEPREVICARLQALWDIGTNFHHLEHIKIEAERLGYELNGGFGDKLRGGGR